MNINHKIQLFFYSFVFFFFYFLFSFCIMLKKTTNNNIVNILNTSSFMVFVCLHSIVMLVITKMKIPNDNEIYCKNVQAWQMPSNRKNKFWNWNLSNHNDLNKKKKKRKTQLKRSCEKTKSVKQISISFNVIIIVKNKQIAIRTNF